MAIQAKPMADGIIEAVGGVENVKKTWHCATRLRFELKDPKKADAEQAKSVPGVVTVVEAGGQFQVVVGNDVPKVYAEVAKLMPTEAETETDNDGPKGGLLNRFVDLVSSIFHPIIWPLAGAGLYKAFLALAVTLGFDAESTSYIVLNAASDALLYFLPVILAVTAAKRFKANQYTAMAIAGALVYPSIVELAGAEGSLDFFGIPLVMMSYASSVIPIIVGVWIQGHLERTMDKVLPAVVRNFGTPLISLIVMVPLILLTVGPLTTLGANAVADGVTWIFEVAPWLGGAIMGGFWQVFVLFGLHWGLVPIMLQQIDLDGFSVLMGPLVGAVLAQASATLAVGLRSKNKEARELAGPSALSGFLSGITEPAIFGINLPRKLPFYFGIVGGATGGIFAGIAGAGTTTFVFPSLIGLPAYLSTPNLPLFFISVGIAVVVAFLLTFFFGVKDDVKQEVAETTATLPVAGSVTEIATPVAGVTLPLANVPDPVFSAGSMGAGIGIVPEHGTVVAPVTGEVMVATKSGHAYGFKTTDGVEVLVHIGIDTVNLNGEGFEALVSVGDVVTAGQDIAKVDLAAVGAAGYDTTTVLIITNTGDLTDVSPTQADRLSLGQTALTVTS